MKIHKFVWPADRVEHISRHNGGIYEKKRLKTAISRRKIRDRHCIWKKIDKQISRMGCVFCFQGDTNLFWLTQVYLII